MRKSNSVTLARKQTKLTIMKKMADVHFTRMHCVRKSLKKANRRTLKDRHKAGG